jgi:hypothetical protein
MSRSSVILGCTGAAGALLMFAADLILYLPASKDRRSAQHYFTSIDPGSNDLSSSSMQDISDFRLMLGGVLGPLASALYSVGFLHLFFGLGGGGGPETSIHAMCLPAAASFGCAGGMIVGGVYHALFAYTGFLAKAIAASKKLGSLGKGDGGEPRVLHAVVGVHQAYLKFTYKFAAAHGAIGSLAFMYCVLARQTIYPAWTVLLAPAMSAPIKKVLKRFSVGGLVLCGGLTNIWNLIFFTAATASAIRTNEDAVLAAASLSVVVVALCMAVYPLLVPPAVKSRHRS